MSSGSLRFESMKRGKFFTDEEVEVLLQFYTDVDVQKWLKRNLRNHTVVWTDLAEKMTAAGYPRTAAQVKDKILNMRRRYLGFRRSLNSGDSMPEWKHWEALHKLYSSHEAVNPYTLMNTQFPFAHYESTFDAVSVSIPDAQSRDDFPRDAGACSSSDDTPPRCIEDTLFTDLFPISFSAAESENTLGRDVRWGGCKTSCKVEAPSPGVDSSAPRCDAGGTGTPKATPVNLVRNTPPSMHVMSAMHPREVSEPALNKLNGEARRKDPIGPLNPYYRYVLCRLCFRTSNSTLVNVFEGQVVKGCTIKDAIEDLLCVQVSKADDFPQHACRDCIRKLSELKWFKDQFFKDKETFEEELKILRHGKAMNAENSIPDAFSESQSGGHPVGGVELDCKREVDVAPSATGGSSDCEQAPLESSCEGGSDALSLASKTSEDWNVEGDVPTDYVEVRLMDNDGEIKCKDCGQVFQYRNQLTEHAKEHAKLRPLPCSYCDKRFKALNELNAHIVAHSDYKPFECEHCGLRFRLKSLLARHKLKHSNLKPFLCSECGKTFPDKFSLRRHATRSHLLRGKKHFGCGHCGKEFASSFRLQDHTRRVHTDDRPFACSDCGKGFPSSGALRSHMSRIHSTSPAKLYQCWVCDRCFSRKRGVLQHMRIHRNGAKDAD